MVKFKLFSSLGESTATVSGMDSALDRFDTLMMTEEKKVSKVYGKRMIEFVNTEDHSLEPPLSTIMKWLEVYALKYEGIFREVAEKADIKKMKRMFEQDPYTEIPIDAEPRAVSGILKAYLSHLPDPFLTMNLMDSFCSAKQDVGKLKELIAQLPEENRIFLEILVRFMLKFSQHSAQNKMDIKNLAIAFSTSLTQSKAATTEQCMLWGSAMPAVLQTLMENADTLLPTTPPKKKAVGKHRSATIDANGVMVWT